MVQLTALAHIGGFNSGVGLMRSMLDFNVKHLATTIEPVGRIHVVRAEASAVRRVFCQLRQLIGNCTAAFTAALLGLFAFWLSHGMFLFEMKLRRATSSKGRGLNGLKPPRQVFNLD
jgi:hypothetical protein